MRDQIKFSKLFCFFCVNFFLVPLGGVCPEVELCKEYKEESHVGNGEGRVDHGVAARVVEEQDQAVAQNSNKLKHLK